MISYRSSFVTLTSQQTYVVSIKFYNLNPDLNNVQCQKMTGFRQ